MKMVHTKALPAFYYRKYLSGEKWLFFSLERIRKGLNDKAKERAIVIHGAPYCNPSLIPYMGCLGCSQGCPALPEVVSKSIINIINGRTLLYIYANDKNYLNKSILLGQ